MTKPTVYHIPVCPFCQRLEILLTLKGKRQEVDFSVVDITRPRPEWLLQKTRGTTALPILEIPAAPGPATFVLHVRARLARAALAAPREVPAQRHRRGAGPSMKSVRAEAARLAEKR